MLDTTDAEGDTVSLPNQQVPRSVLHSFVFKLLFLLCIQPLHHAVRGEHLDIVHFFLVAGASPKKRNVY